MEDVGRSIGMGADGRVTYAAGVRNFGGGIGTGISTCNTLLGHSYTTDAWDLRLEWAAIGAKRTTLYFRRRIVDTA